MDVSCFENIEYINIIFSLLLLILRIYLDDKENLSKLGFLLFQKTS